MRERTPHDWPTTLQFRKLYNISSADYSNSSAGDKLRDDIGYINGLDHMTGIWSV